MDNVINYLQILFAIPGPVGLHRKMLDGKKLTDLELPPAVVEKIMPILPALLANEHDIEGKNFKKRRKCNNVYGKLCSYNKKENCRTKE